MNAWGVVLAPEYSLYLFKECVLKFHSVSSSWKSYALKKEVVVINKDGPNEAPFSLGWALLPLFNLKPRMVLAVEAAFYCNIQAGFLT